MKVVNRTSLWKGKFLETILISYIDRNGVLRDWEAIDRINAKGVAVIIPITEQNELILIKQYRPALNKYVIELPAGLVEDDEDYMATGRRELIEETGYSSSDLTLLTEGVISTGINTEEWRVVIANNVKEASPEVLANHSGDDNEDIEVLKVSLDGLYTALENLRSDDVAVDLRIYGLVELAKRKLKL
jgi:ADP-ribose pyrophosphatase